MAMLIAYLTGGAIFVEFWKDLWTEELTQMVHCCQFRMNWINVKVLIMAGCLDC